jgi:hypothetical protein
VTINTAWVQGLPPLRHRTGNFSRTCTPGGAGVKAGSSTLLAFKSSSEQSSGPIAGVGVRLGGVECPAARGRQQRSCEYIVIDLQGRPTGRPAAILLRCVVGLVGASSVVQCCAGALLTCYRSSHYLLHLVGYLTQRLLRNQELIDSGHQRGARIAAGVSARFARHARHRRVRRVRRASA